MPLRMRFNEVAEEIKQKASEALLQTGQDIFAVSQQLVPVDTGALKQSGGVEVVSSSQIRVGYGNGPVNYALWVEYGSAGGGGSAQPFLTPAFAQAKDTFETRLRQKLKEVK